MASNILFVVGDATTPDADDANLKTMLEGKGHTVTYIDDGTVTNGDMASYDVTLVSDTCVLASVNGLFYDQSYPLVYYHFQATIDYDMATNEARSGNTTAIDILDNTHPITSGYSTGNLTVLTSAERITESATSGWGAGADNLAESPSSTDTCLGVYDSGATKATGTAPARQAMLFCRATAPSNLTSTGEDVISDTIDWAAGNLGGTTHNLTANALASSTSVDSPALTQVHDLSASALASSSAVDSPALTQTHDLSASEIASTSAVDAPALTEGHSLTANTLNSGTAVDSPAITQVHNLTGSEIASTSTNEAPVITQNHSLIASEIASTTSVDSPALTQVHSLSANEVGSSTTVDSPSLSQNHVLSASEIASQTVVDSPALGSGYALTANEITSQTTIGTPGLGVVHQLIAEALAAASENEVPAITQVHVLTASDLSVSTSVGSPELGSPFYEYPQTVVSAIGHRSANSEIGPVGVGSKVKVLSANSAIGSKAVNSTIKELI